MPEPREPLQLIQNASCRKCGFKAAVGFTTFTYKYCEHNHIRSMAPSPWKIAADLHSDIPDPHLHVTCNECGYEALAYTLDDIRNPLRGK